MSSRDSTLLVFPKNIEFMPERHERCLACHLKELVTTRHDLLELREELQEAS